MRVAAKPAATDQPLCLNQEQLLLSREWMQSQGAAGSPSVTPTVLHFLGPLNTSALEQALNEIVRRHPALRVRFHLAPEIQAGERARRLQQFASGVYTPGMYRQRVSSAASVSVERVDATRLDARQVDEAFENLMREEAAKPFDFVCAPRLRAALFARGAEDHLLIVSADHAVADAWSMRILRKELAFFYDQFCGSPQGSLPEPKLSYPDYAERQEQALASGALDSSVSYWKQQWERYASSRVAYDDLPFALPAPRRAPDRFVAERLIVGPDVCDAIRTFARLSRVSLNMFFFAAYAAVLQSYTRKPRTALWCHFANRGQPDVQNTIGYFVHAHLIGLDFPDELTGSELLWQTRKAMLDALEHQQAPVAHVWQAMNRWPRYADSRVLADYHQADEPWEDSEWAGGLSVRRVEPPGSLIPRFSGLGFYVRDSREGMILEVTYSQLRFAPGAACDLLDELQVMIGHMLVHPDSRVRDFSSPRYGLAERAASSKMGEFVGLGQPQDGGPPEVEVL